MKIKYEYQKYHPWFGLCIFTPQTRDIADLVIFFFKIQIKFWNAQNPWRPK